MFVIVCDLVEKMLRFNLFNRIIVEEVLVYFYLVVFYDLSDELMCYFMFDFDVYFFSLIVEYVKIFIWREVIFINV